MVQWLRVCAAFAGDPSLVLSTGVRLFITFCSPIIIGSDALVWPPQALNTRGAYTDKQAPTNKCKKSIINSSIIQFLIILFILYTNS